MQKIIIEGIATFTDKSFHFDSGIPSSEPLLPEAINLNGAMKISKNGCAHFQGSRRVILPPQVDIVAKGEGYHIKRTSRNYIVQVKVPIVESRAITEDTIKNLVPVIMGDITLDRREVLGEAVR